MTMAEDRKYFDPDVLNKIAHLEFRARQVVEGFMTGGHKSPYRGSAVEFSQHRAYVPGDDTKHIDWKVWSKTDRFYVKEYEEETNVGCTIVLDCSKSMAYGSEGGGGIGDGNGVGVSKYDYGATLGACLGYMLSIRQDAVGLTLFDDEVREMVPLSSHGGHVRRMIEVMCGTECGGQTDIGGVLREVAGRVRRRGLVVVVSDLFGDVEELRAGLTLLSSRKHEVIVFHVMHEDEVRFRFSQNTLFRGLESVEEVRTEPRALRKRYLAAKDEFVGVVRKVCGDLGIDYVGLSTADGLDVALSRYLVFRERSLVCAR